MSPIVIRLWAVIIPPPDADSVLFFESKELALDFALSLPISYAVVPVVITCNEGDGIPKVQSDINPKSVCPFCADDNQAQCGHENKHEKGCCCFHTHHCFCLLLRESVINFRIKRLHVDDSSIIRRLDHIVVDKRSHGMIFITAIVIACIAIIWSIGQIIERDK